MRDLDAALLAEQKKSSVTPYTRVHLEAAAGSPTYTFALNDSPNRLYSVFHREEPYGGIAIIQLKNPDSYFNSINLKGYKVTIGWGLDTSAGNKYSSPASLWVLSQKEISEEGQLLTELACIDIWGLLARDEVYIGGTELKGTVTWKITGADARTERITGGTSGAKATIYEVYDDRIHVVQPEGLNGTFQVGETAESTSLKIVISAVGAIGEGGVAPPYDGTFSVFTIIQHLLTGFTTLTLDSDDPEGNAQNYKPKYQIVLGAKIRSVIMDVLGFTKCGLRMRTDGMHMLYLDPSPASADYIFDSVHKFKSENRERAIVTPNRIFVTNTDEEGEVYVGYGVDTDSYNALGKWLSRIDVVPSVASDADATARAVALIARAKAEANAGDVVVPIMNCGQEVYDWLQITDSRNNNIVITGRVGAVERRYAPGIYQMSARLGGLSTSADITPEGIPESNIQAEPVSPVDITPKMPIGANLPPGAQAYICDIRFTSVNWNTVSWGAGTVTIGSGATLTINSGSKDLANDNPYYAYFIWGNHVLQWTQTYGNTIGEDRGLIGVIKRGSSTSDKAYAQNFFTDSILINRDKVMDNLVNELKLANEAVSTAKLQDLCIVAGKIQTNAITSQKIYAGAITTIKLDAHAVDATKIAAWAVTSDKIYAGAVTATKIAAGAITADKLTATLVLTSTIWAGTNKVKLDSTGIKVYGQSATFYYGTTQRGFVKGTYSGFDVVSWNCPAYFQAAAGHDLYLGGREINLSDPTGVSGLLRLPISGGIAFRTVAKATEGSIKIKGAGSGDIYIYSSGAWRTNT